MLIRPIILVSLFIFSLQSLFAQRDSVAFSNPIDSAVEIIAPNFNEGLSQRRFSAATLANYQGLSVSELLNKEAGVFIKQYGAGMLATISSRGGGAAHSALLWEGINILNPMLGQSDLSLLPIAFIDEANWQLGASSALNGNNAIGGVLQMQSQSAFDLGWQGMGYLQIGSFGEQKQQIRLSLGKKRYAGSLRGFHQSTNNNFQFRDVNAFGFPKPLKTLTNAQQASWGLLQENRFRIGQRQQLSLKSWYQQTYRQIPPTLLQSIGDQEQQWDAAWRNLLAWQYTGLKTVWKADLSWIWERLDYESVVLRSNSRTMLASAKISQWLLVSAATAALEQSLRWGLDYQLQSAFSDNYKRGQSQIAAHIAYKLSKQSWTLNGSLRQQWVDGHFLLPAFSINGQWEKPTQGPFKLGVQASASHNYRYPTLNDRFWPLAGNPDLLPEYSWSQDCRLQLAYQARAGRQISLSAGAFSNSVRNWILWSPLPGSGLWRPQNVATVWARGLETGLRLQWALQGPLRLEAQVQHQLTLAQRVADSDLQLLGKQLIYTPVHSLSGGLELHYANKFSVCYRHSYFSPRFLDNGNVESLPAYQIGWLQVRYLLHLKPLQIQLQCSIDNLWGAEYQVVANRPMPRRMVQVGLALRF